MQITDMTDAELLSFYHQKVSEESQYEAIQMAFKIALNSLYGASANQYFRYYNPNIGEGITLTGQCIIRYINNCLNDFMNDTLKTTGIDYICAGDTDSCYLTFKDLVNKICPADMDIQKKVDFLDKFVKKYVEPFIDKKFKELSAYLNARVDKLSMKREAIADKAIWRGKKNYIIQIYDNEGVRYAEPKLKMMGVETARSSTPKISKVALEAGYKIMLNGTQEELIEHTKAFKLKFMEADLSAIAFPRGVSDMDKWTDSVTIWKKGTPIHVKAALMYNILLEKHGLTNKYARIANGNKLKFIYLKEPNPTMSNTIAFTESLHAEFGLDQYIDRELQYDKVFLSPLKSFSDLVNMDTKKIMRLSNFFSDDAPSAVNTVALPPTMFHNPVVKAKAPQPKVENVSTNNVSQAPKKPKAPKAKKLKPTLATFFQS